MSSTSTSTETCTFSINLDDIHPMAIKRLKEADEARTAAASQTAHESILAFSSFAFGTEVSAKYSDVTSNSISVTTDDTCESGIASLKEMITELLSRYLLGTYRFNGDINVYEVITDNFSEAIQSFLVHSGHELIDINLTNGKHILTTKSQHTGQNHEYALRVGNVIDRELIIFYAI